MRPSPPPPPDEGTRLGPLVTLTSDFGLTDSYVGEMKGAILMRAGVSIVDITHDLRPGDVHAGAWTLRRIWTRFPAGTVHLCVVDPTVGSDRRAIAARAAERWFVGPDNGLLGFLGHPSFGPLEIDEVRSLRPPPDPTGMAPTFHGRDLFAPAAAALATGGPDEALGEPLAPASLVPLDITPPRRGPGGITGTVVHVDRFGNLVTDIPVGWLAAEPRVRVGATTLAGLSTSYADVLPGEPLLTRGSAETLEVSVRDGRADDTLGVSRGDAVVAAS